MAQGLSAAHIREQRAFWIRLRKRLLYGIGGALFLGIVIYFLFVPYKGDMRFGVCKTLLELNVPTPTTLRLTGLIDNGMEITIWFTHTNPYGQYRVEPITCVYKQDPAAPGGFSLARAQIGRVWLPDEAIKSFNLALPAIYANPPDLTIPAPLPDALEDLRIDPTKYYRTLF